MGQSRREFLLAGGTAGLGLLAWAGADPAAATGSPTPLSSEQSVDLDGRHVYLTVTGTRRPRQPAVVLLAGYHDSADVWTRSDVLSLHRPAVGPPVFEALATFCRAYAYDRPGTLRYIDGAPLTKRTTPTAQPRTAADVVSELHSLLGAAHVAPPYLLVGHSLGGLFAQLYARQHPGDVAGIVFVDAFSATVPSQFGALWPTYRDQLLNPPLDQEPLPSLRSPVSERIDLDTSANQVLAAPALRAIPIVVLTKTASFAGLKDLPGLPASAVNQLYEQAERAIVQLAPTTPQIFATGSDHYIQFSQPDLVVHATQLVMDRSRT